MSFRLIRNRHQQQQRIALQFSCRLGFETAHPRFGWKEGGYSVVLSVNSGYE